MLIVAQPRSASTSLLAMLEAATGLPGRQIFYAKPCKKLRSCYPVPRPFAPLPHADMIDAPQALFNRWCGRRGWYKQHLPPTATNVKRLLSTGRAVVLLRNPADSYSSYVRMGKGTGHAMERALHQYHDGWQKLRGRRRLLFLTFDDVISDHRNTIHTICRFFRIRVRRPVPLLRVEAMK